MPPAPDTQAGKSIQDRIGEVAGNERLVSREEQPVELRDPTANNAPRVVLPSPVAPAPNAAPPLAGTPPTGEAKRVRTLTIRPDGPDSNGRPVGGLPSTNSQAVTPPARAPARPAQTIARVAGGPLSLDPQAAGEQASAPPPPPPARTRTAALPPPAATAPAPSSGGSGGYVVQVSSQRSESEAQASFRSLQAKYPNQLKGRQTLVKRADLGGKGVYYRAMIGPFASSEEAGQFCSGLKAAGGQCIIQRN